jgi:2-oxoglutarate ferredoxin oxidoreductase subunit gamma
MQKDVIFAGFGGQGILLMGSILAHAALDLGYEVAWIPSYGAEMRGGTANCTVVLGDRPIGSPIIRNPQHLVAMNLPSLDKFVAQVKPGGVILINSSLISIGCGRSDVDELKVPANEIANNLGSVKAANIVALAAFVARSKIVDMEIIRECIKSEFKSKPDIARLNMAAIEEGEKAAAQQ